MIQLVKPNFSVSGTIGACLIYARNVFGAPAGVLYAHQAWLNAQYKHSPNEPLPTDVSVLMWYDYYVGSLNEGHVTVNQPGVGIWSSPWEKGTTHALLSSIAQVESIYHCAYVGWTEDINGTRVAEGADMITKEQEQTCALMQTYSLPGVDYNYQFTGLPLTQDNLDKMLQFWSTRPRPTQPTTGFSEYTLPQLYVKD